MGCVLHRLVMTASKLTFNLQHNCIKHSLMQRLHYVYVLETIHTASNKVCL